MAPYYYSSLSNYMLHANYVGFVSGWVNCSHLTNNCNTCNHMSICHTQLVTNFHIITALHQTNCNKECQLKICIKCSSAVSDGVSGVNAVQGRQQTFNIKCAYANVCCVILLNE